MARVLPGEEGQVVLAEAAGAAWGLCAGHDVLEPRGHVHLQRLVAFDEVVLLGGQGGKRGGLRGCWGHWGQLIGDTGGAEGH